MHIVKLFSRKSALLYSISITSVSVSSLFMSSGRTKCEMLSPQDLAAGNDSVNVHW